MPGANILDIGNNNLLMNAKFKNKSLTHKKKNKKTKKNKSNLKIGKMYLIKSIKNLKTSYIGTFHHLEQLETNPPQIMVYFKNMYTKQINGKIPNVFNIKNFKFISIN